ncbi:MAG: glycine-rich domain-containing protein-like [Gemmataceae bacterium]|nr:glycine-rich domain-containing protein-like [Gemmataceae bacterium]
MAKRKKSSEFIEFSEDMIAAAGRSRGPLSKLDEAGREYVLERYRKFLALAKRYPKQPLAPTGDIDEMWHLHMLMPRAYVNDCNSYFGEILDHRAGFDPSDAPKLREVFEKTAELWEEEFGEPYLKDQGSRSPLLVCFSAAEQAAARCHI